MKPVLEAVAKAIENLRDEEHRLVAELRALKEQEQALAANLKTVRAGIEALSGKSETKTGEGRATMSAAIVKDLVLQVLKTSGTVSLPKLKAAVLEEAKTRGYSGTGLHQVLRRVLQDHQVLETPQGYVLKSAEA